MIQMSQKTISETQRIRTAICWKNCRKKLVDQYCFQEAARTYSQQHIFLSDGNTGVFWDEKFAENLPDIHHMEYWRLGQIANLIDGTKNLLNIGAGSGRLEQVLWGKFGDRLNYSGTDITEETLSKLRSRFPEWKFFHRTLENIGFAAASFQQILLLEVLEHIKPSETLQTLKTIHTLLEPGGRFIVSVPINEGLESMLPVNPNQHMRFYSEQLLKFELQWSGFDVLEVRRASAFAKGFWWKQLLNSVVCFAHANNLIFICQKRK